MFLSQLNDVSGSAFLTKKVTRNPLKLVPFGVGGFAGNGDTVNFEIAGLTLTLDSSLFAGAGNVNGIV